MITADLSLRAAIISVIWALTGSPPACTNRDARLRALAEAYGCVGLPVGRAEEVDGAIEAALAHPKRTVVICFQPVYKPRI